MLIEFTHLVAVINTKDQLMESMHSSGTKEKDPIESTLRYHWANMTKKKIGLRVDFSTVIKMPIGTGLLC